METENFEQTGKVPNILQKRKAANPPLLSASGNISAQAQNLGSDANRVELSPSSSGHQGDIEKSPIITPITPIAISTYTSSGIPTDGVDGVNDYGTDDLISFEDFSAGVADKPASGIESASTPLFSSLSKFHKDLLDIFSHQTHATGTSPTNVPTPTNISIPTSAEKVLGSSNSEYISFTSPKAPEIHSERTNLSSITPPPFSKLPLKLCTTSSNSGPAAVINIPQNSEGHTEKSTNTRPIKNVVRVVSAAEKSILDKFLNLGASPSLPTQDKPALVLRGDFSSKMETPKMPTDSPNILDNSSTTALTTRKVNDVFADLKRPLHNHETQFRPENQEDQHTVGSTTSETVDSTKRFEAERKEEDEQNPEDEDDEEDPIQPVPDIKKISTRKQKNTAIFDTFLLEVSKKPKAEKISSAEDDAKQSTRWLIDQSESHQIISSPREYQMELFERAKEKNIIAVLDTGSGKTLIAVLLLRHIFAQELEDRSIGKPKRVAFFLVDSVTLCYQQHAVLKANLDQPMDMFCGIMETEVSDAKKWKKRMETNMVIVCTAEILRQCLHHSFVTMDHVNLMIFDEAHHAKKDHPYARIIKDFYTTEGSETLTLPKIFGMTASPVDAKTNVTRAAAELEGLLHSQIATASDPSMLQYSIKGKPESIVRYDALGPRFETELFKKINQLLGENGIFRKPFIYAKEQSRTLGTWCVDQIWTFCLEEMEVKKLKAKTEARHHKRRVPETLTTLDIRKEQLDEAKEVVENHPFQTPHWGSKLSDDLTKQIHYSNNMSPKVLSLVTILKDRYQRPTNDKCIIFVKQRYTARLLASLLSQPSAGTPFLKVAPLVGTRAAEAGDLNLSFREQVLTMMDFRNGKTNCLIATSVAEEGLDIPDCNVVIRFDLYDTVIQYIQSRGRARRANSKFYHMIEDSNEEHLRLIREILAHEKLLKQFAQALPEDRKLTGNDFNMDYFLKKERTHRVHTVKSTGAKLTYKMSLSVLSAFVDSLPHTPDTKPRVDYVITIQNKQFIGEVILPEESPIRGAIGRPSCTKQVAKCSAAFETCLALRKGGYIDEWLMSTFKRSAHVMRNALLAVDSKKRESYDMRTKPALWSERGTPEQFFMTVLSLENPDALDRASQPLAILTRSRLPDLPSFYLHFGAGRNSLVHLTSLKSPLKLDTSTLDQINEFTLCTFLDVFSKGYESDKASMPYFLVPVHADVVIKVESQPSELVVWEVLKEVQAFEAKQADKPWKHKPWLGKGDEYFKDKFIVDPFDGSRKLWSVGLTREYKPLDPVPPSTAPRVGSRKDNSNIMEYSCSLWTKARARRTFDPDQPVIEASYISLRRNLLDEFDLGEVEKLQKCFVILEPLKVSPLPTTVVAMIYLFPAIIHRLESYLIALEVTKLLHLDIRPDLALEAVTKDSDNTEDHGEEQTTFQRGMGNNYERLEFLGDCFLKMATSIALFGLDPDSDEFRYHVDRMCLICNKNLFKNALDLGLQEYIRCQAFNRRAWYPEGLKLTKGKTATALKTQKLGDKSIADVCEALIGAALLSSHETKSMDNAVRAVTEVVCSENHKALAWSDYYKLYQKPKYQTAPSTAVQLDLAKQVQTKHPYRFRYPRLLRSAFTHPAYNFQYEHVPSYQRLEFLGDSLLDMVCVNFLFHNHPGKDPQWLTEHKMAMVSNQFLGALCVKLGFNKHLLTLNGQIQKAVADYVFDIEEALNQAREDAKRAGKSEDDYAPDYWITVRQPPKCLPDLVEAYIGAVFVDSEYDYSEVERFFDMHMKGYFKDMSIYDTYANKHPTTFLTNFLQKNMGCEDWAPVSKELPGEDGRKSVVHCGIIVHNQVVSVFQAESIRYAKLGAAKKALAELDGLSLREFRERFGCECKGDVLDEEGKVEFVEKDETLMVTEEVLKVENLSSLREVMVMDNLVVGDANSEESST